MLPRRTSQAKAVSRPAIVRFDLNGFQLAVPARLVREVITVGAYAPLPCESPAHLGIILHRGAVLPLVDLGVQLQFRRASAIRLPARCLILKSGSGDIACPVEQVFGLAPATDEWLTRQTTLPGDLTVLGADVWEKDHGQVAVG